MSLEAMQDSVALALVNSEYERYRIWRNQNHDPRWNTADALFWGWMPQRYWEGTRVPRSSLSVNIAFGQIESAAPVIMNALFGDVEWFEVDALPGATVDQARQQKERLMYLLENPNNRIGNTARNEIRLAVKQLLTYGNGFACVEHDGETGDPVLSWVDTRDLFLDPGTPTPLLDDARSMIHLDWLTVDELEALRGAEGIKLPPYAVLRVMASQRPWTTSDNTKQIQEAYRGVAYRPGYDDQTSFAPYQKIEIRRYWDKNRIIWVLNGVWVMYNELNPYGFVPYNGAPCTIVPGRLYGMGIPDAVESDQKASQALLNGHMDNLALALNPPRARSRSGAMTQGQSSIRPGQVWEMSDPQKDMVFPVPPANTTGNWQEIQFFESSAEKRTGVTGMITSGMPVKSNASRTATSIQAQSAGPTTRMQQIVEYIEDYLVVPLLYKMIAMDAHHAQAGDSSLRGMTPTGGQTQVDPTSLKAPVKFRIKASSRMLTQQRLQGLAPFLAQYLLNGAFASQLAKAGQAVDFNEFFRLIQDATGTRTAYNLVRPMTDQEKQAMGQPPPQEVMRQQTAKMQIDSREHIAQIGAQAVKDAAAAKAAEGDEKIAVQLLEMFTQLDAQQGLSPEGAPGKPGAQPSSGQQQILGG